MKKMFIVALIIAFAAACGGKKTAPKGPDMGSGAGSDMGSAAGSGDGSGAGDGSAPAPEGGGSGG